jgi:hypothetical protein
MVVFLIPTTTPDSYELYYEAPDEEVVEEAEAGIRFVPAFISGYIHRAKLRFAETIKEAEEWRHRRHEEQPRPKGMIGRARRKVMGFVVERIAEQRLLWHMRHATAIRAAVPADLGDAEANEVVRAMLKKDVDHHFKWMWIDVTLLVLSAPLMLIPGPNVPGFYFFFQVVGHYLSWRGAQQGLSVSEWTFTKSADLLELRAAMTLDEAPRQRIFQDIERRLRLDHLATFCEDVAAPPA